MGVDSVRVTSRLSSLTKEVKEVSNVWTNMHYSKRDFRMQERSKGIFRTNTKKKESDEYGTAARPPPRLTNACPTTKQIQCLPLLSSMMRFLNKFCVANTDIVVAVLFAMLLTRTTNTSTKNNLIDTTAQTRRVVREWKTS